MNDPQLDSLRADIKKVEPFFEPMGEPGQFDWLTTFHEPGQTFEEYIADSPIVPAAPRNVIHVQPIGVFGEKQLQAIETTSNFMNAFFGLPVKLLDAEPPLPKLNEPDQRMIDYPRHRQIRSGYFLEKMLPRLMPPDAIAMIAFTNEDLYPNKSMYFVFGQASVENRVGVVSLFRLVENSDPDTVLHRMLKFAVHETGHMFSMRHCTKYECVMSGTNHLGETDRRPIDTCPECMAKICWMNKERPAERYTRLAEFTRKAGMNGDSRDFEKKLASLR